MPHRTPMNHVVLDGTTLAVHTAVNIRFTSSLTPEDENVVAPAVLKALAGILDLLPIAYMIRIDTSDAQVYQHSGPTTRLTNAVDRTFSKSSLVAPYESQ